MKKVFLCVILCLSMLGVSGYAASEGQPAIVDGSALLMTDYAQSWETGISAYGEYLSVGGCSIKKVNNNVAQVHGYTECCRMSDTVYIGVFMDRYDETDGSWHTVYQDSYTAEDTIMASFTKDVYVKSGYFYRVRAAHIVTENGITEGNVSYTDGIYFG